MGKHTGDNQPKGLSKAEKARIRNMEKFEELSDKAIEYISKCMGAMIPCNYCDSMGAAPKKDEAGLCIKCHGTKLLANDELRKWATEEIASRTAPKPKAMEMALEHTTSVDEWSKKAESLSDDEVNKLAAQLGVVFTDEPGK